MTEVFGEKAIVNEAAVVNRQFENTKPTFIDSFIHSSIVENETGYFRLFDFLQQDFLHVDIGPL